MNIFRGFFAFKKTKRQIFVLPDFFLRVEKTKRTIRKIVLLSEWRDSNARPLAPHARMLANCTTPRFEIGLQR